MSNPLDPIFDAKFKTSDENIIFTSNDLILEKEGLLNGDRDLAMRWDQIKSLKLEERGSEGCFLLIETNESEKSVEFQTYKDDSIDVEVQEQLSKKTYGQLLHMMKRKRNPNFSSLDIRGMDVIPRYPRIIKIIIGLVVLLMIVLYGFFS